MFELVVIFLATIIVSVSAVWLYRKVSSWHGVNETLVGRTQTANQAKIGSQSGFIKAVSKPRQKARNVRLRSTNGDIQKPWGW